jgi:cation diffusion facilitator family transporter
MRRNLPIPHPYGHHKAEYFSAVLEGVLIVVAALLIVHEAIGGLMEPRRIEAPALGSGSQWQALLSSTGSGPSADPLPAGVTGLRRLQADGHHILSDVVTSVGVIFGLGLAIMFDQPRLDPLLALIVAINVLWQGWKVIASSVDGLDGSGDRSGRRTTHSRNHQGRGGWRHRSA